MKTANVHDLKSSYALALYSAGHIEENVEVREIGGFDWDSAKDDLLKTGVLSPDNAEKAIYMMRKNTIPCKIVNNQGEEIKNEFGILGAFFVNKKDIKEHK